MSDRGQALTLEAFVAAILLLATVAFALQAVAITANTGGSQDAESRGQHAGLAQGILDGAAERGDLTTTLAYWNESAERFYGVKEDERAYISPGPNSTFARTPLGSELESAFAGGSARYNVNLHYLDEDGQRRTQPLVDSGTPSSDSVRIVETVTLYDDTRLVAENGTARETSLGDLTAAENETFYAPDTDPEGRLYNVVRVEVIIW